MVHFSRPSIAAKPSTLHRCLGAEFQSLRGVFRGVVLVSQEGFSVSRGEFLIFLGFFLQNMQFLAKFHKNSPFCGAFALSEVSSGDFSHMGGLVTSGGS